MPKAKGTEGLLAEIVAGQQTQLIVDLALAGLAQHQIRAIVGVDMNRITRIVKHLRSIGGGRNEKDV
jgi:hypothetical protein